MGKWVLFWIQKLTKKKFNNNGKIVHALLKNRVLDFNRTKTIL